MSRFWSQKIQNISPYIPGEQPADKKYIKLNTNENPYPPSPAVLEAISAETTGDVRLYPDPEAAGLKKALSRFYKVAADEVFVGNGSDEVLAFCFPAFFNPEDIIAFPKITYSFYPIYADLFGVKYLTVPMEPDFSIDVERFPEGMKGILIANPNAPTGMVLNIDKIEYLLKKFPDTLVIVDEAYVDFGAESAVPVLARYDNLLVINTFSKSRSLAGLRVGFALGNASLIQGLERVKNSFNSYTIDRIAQKAAIAAVNDSEYFKENCRRVAATRENSRKALTELGFQVLPSKTNFLFATHRDYTADFLLKRLKQEGILVRHFNKPEISNWLRISVGTDEDMGVLIEKLKEIMV